MALLSNTKNYLSVCQRKFFDSEDSPQAEFPSGLLGKWGEK